MRKYSSTLRQSQAKKNKKRLLSVAKKLFETKGFDQVTIDEIAQTAELSTSTIYTLFQSKRGLLAALLDAALPQELHEELVEKARFAESAEKFLEITASIARQVYDAEKKQITFLRGVSVVDPEFKKMEKEKERRRYLRQSDFVTVVAKKKMFDENLTLKQVKDIIWSLTGRDLYRMLVIEQGWSSYDYETWLAQCLKRTLIK